jgi:hypothetical protein
LPASSSRTKTPCAPAPRLGASQGAQCSAALVQMLFE